MSHHHNRKNYIYHTEIYKQDETKDDEVKNLYDKIENDVPYLFFKNVSFKYNNSLQNLVQPDISPWKIVLRTIAPYEIQIITPE